jgi:peptidoglycan/xylan/chitin deacetylase (PgdA/CDA1 family)
VYFANTDGTEYYLGLRDAPASALWNQYSETFQVPANAKTMTVFHLVGAIGWLTTDDYSLNKITPKGFTRPLVTLTFDDGWEDNVNTALPILKTYGYKATYYFATTYLENSPLTGPANVSGPTAVKTIFADGHEIGSHSVTHPDLTTLTSTQLTQELTHSKSYLEGLVGAETVKSFATPFGAYNDTVLAALRLQYTSHRPTDEGFNTQENFDAYRLKVQNMQNTTTLAEYQSWINEAIKDKSWLILVYHRVASTSLEQWDTPLNDFQPQLEVLKNAGVTVETITQALNEASSQHAN